MWVRIFALGFVCVASLCGQKHFSWQDACFKNLAAPYCPGHDYAIKPPAKAKETTPRSVVTSPFPSTRQNAPPSLIVVGAIDWRFADPFADALAGFNFGGLSASPLARGLVAQLGASQGLTETDIQKIFDGLSDVDQVAISVHNNRMVAMVTGRVTDSALPAPGADLKTVTISGNAILVGSPDAVDQAVQRMAMKVALPELTRSAEERQANSEFWATGSPAFLGPQAANAGVKRFSLTVSIRDRFTSDVAFEFNGIPTANTLQMWRTTLGATTVEGNVAHVRMSMEAEEARQKFAQIAASPFGDRLAALLKAAQYLPMRDTSVPKQTKPVIYGLDDGPRVVNQ